VKWDNHIDKATTPYCILTAEAERDCMNSVTEQLQLGIMPGIKAIQYLAVAAGESSVVFAVGLSSL
jgi:hypothetical protein